MFAETVSKSETTVYRMKFDGEGSFELDDDRAYMLLMQIINNHPFDEKRLTVIGVREEVFAGIIGDGVKISDIVSIEPEKLNENSTTVRAWIVTVTKEVETED